MEGFNRDSDDHHFLREDRALLWRRISAHLAAHPEELHIPLENIDRWLGRGRLHPAPLLDWRDRILAARESALAFEQLIAFIAAPNCDSEPIKSCSPFVGLSFQTPAA